MNFNFDLDDTVDESKQTTSKRIKEKIEKVLDEEFPDLNRNEQYHKLFCELDSFCPENKFCLYSDLGQEICSIVKKHGVSSKRTIHLLSSFNGAGFTRKQAIRIIGVDIGPYLSCESHVT